MLVQNILLFLATQLHPIPDSAIAQYNWEGTLKECGDGFVYIDLDDGFIHDLIHYIEPDGFIEPPYFGKTGLIGAHISVIYADEIRNGAIEELGQTFSFTPIECKIVHPPDWSDVEDLYLIEVDAPELDLIRKKYGLEKRELGFHITIGVKFF